MADTPRSMESQNPDKRLTGLMGYLYGHALMRLLQWRNIALLQDTRPLALHLETDLFPVLRDEGQGWLHLNLVEGTGGHFVEGVAGRRRYPFKNAHALANLMRRRNIQCLRLDTQLESGQIIETMLTLLYALPRLDRVEPLHQPYGGWNRDKVAARMRSSDGFHKFCASMRFHPETRCFEVEYSYCELFLSKAVRNYVEGRTRFRDHRVLFHAAPRVVTVGLVVFLLPLFVLQWSLLAAELIWLGAGVAASVLLGVYTYMVGAFLYTREHHDALIEDYITEVKKLSRFPESNPNPTMEVDIEGRPIYLNPAAQAFFAGAEPGQVMPSLYHDIVRECVAHPETPYNLEFEYGGHHYNFSFQAFPGARSVIASGKDVTYLKKVEAELRQLNKDIQEKNIQLNDAFAQLDDEMRSISDIQKSLLPPGMPAHPHLEFAAHYESSRRAGGDYYDYFDLPDGRLALLIADVSGHGAPAAVLMAITQCITFFARGAMPEGTPSELLAFINRVLAAEYTGENGRFVTAFLGVFSADGRTLTHASAGHNPPRLRTRQGEIHVLRQGDGVPLGISTEMHYDDFSQTFQPGDCVVFYTDGITEAMNNQQELFDAQRLDAAITAAGGGPQIMVSQILAAVQEFTQGHPANDDRTLVVAQIKD